MDMESKFSAAEDVKARTHERNNELAVRLACEDTRRLRMTDAWHALSLP